MQRDELRLECLKLAVSKTPDFNEGVLRAERYFEFITEGQEAKNEKPETTPAHGASVTVGKDNTRPAKG